MVLLSGTGSRRSVRRCRRRARATQTRCEVRPNPSVFSPRLSRLTTSREAMTATQGRLADTIDVFYSAADKASEGAMAAHAYKRAVDDLDTGIGRELVRLPLFLGHPEPIYECSASQETPYRTTVMEPLGKMNAIFPVVNEHISKRAHKVHPPPFHSPSFFRVSLILL